MWVLLMLLALPSDEITESLGRRNDLKSFSVKFDQETTTTVPLPSLDNETTENRAGNSETQSFEYEWYADGRYWLYRDRSSDTHTESFDGKELKQFGQLGNGKLVGALHEDDDAEVSLRVDLVPALICMAPFDEKLGIAFDTLEFEKTANLGPVECRVYKNPTDEIWVSHNRQIVRLIRSENATPSFDIAIDYPDAETRIPRSWKIDLYGGSNTVIKHMESRNVSVDLELAKLSEITFPEGTLVQWYSNGEVQSTVALSDGSLKYLRKAEVDPNKAETVAPAAEGLSVQWILGGLSALILSIARYLYYRQS